ncbi:MAG: TMEM165/GDT1 family protein [Clostridia bacterium]|nr:TMEM165/GDT1 family protein [Clostridia bacterium]
MNWKLFFTAFGLLFLAELGDKTQMTVFTLVTQNKQPVPIFLGASLALVLVTLLAVIFGDVIAKYIPVEILQVIAGTLFVVIGVVVLWGAIPDFITKFFR